ncbi:SpoIIE family protein phosphatase [Kitasatospora sp. NPDC089797]|uniref:ATP-binding SpoIIE family protein phosphatase n=1 Tax=Kitasatospora sp. NPDC089797 TaxID=3155298 RepID=UPI0034236739
MSTTDARTPGTDPERARPAAVVDDDGGITLWTPTARHLLGYGPDEVTGHPAARLLAAPLPVPVLRAVAAHRAWSGLLWARHRDGHPVELGVEAHPCPQVDGSRRWVLLVEPDRRTEERLVGRAFTQSPIALAAYDNAGRLLHANDALVRLAGKSLARMRGLALEEIHPYPPYLELGALQQQVLATATAVRTRLDGAPPGGGPACTWDVCVTPLRTGDGRVNGLGVAIIDVTQEARARRRLLLANAACDRIGGTLDATRTARELVETLTDGTDGFADFAAVDLYDAPRPGEGRSADRAGTATLRRAHASLLGGSPGTAPRPGEPVAYPPGSPFARALEDGGLHRCRPDPAEDLPPALGAAAGHSLVLVPITARGERLGLATLARGPQAEPFDRDDLLLAQEIVQRAAISIDNARRYAHERDIALALQRALLPCHVPDQRALELALRYRPGHEGRDIGGVWCDVIPLSGARVALVAGDVSTRGVDASAAMGRLRTAVRALADLDLAPDELLAHLDDLVTQLAHEERSDAHRLGGHPASGTGATCLYAVYDPVSRRLCAASAGHPAPVLHRPGRAPEPLPVAAGPPLGTGGITFESIDVDLPDATVLAVYSGRIHGAGEAGPETVRRALAAVGAADDLGPGCDRVLRALPAGSDEDDVALLAARTHGLPASRVAGWDVPPDPEAVGRIRHELGGLLARWGLADAVFTTELVVTELLTNAIRYGRAPVRLRLIRDRRLICEISDGGATAPRLRRAGADDEGGRGLYLVAQLTRRWGTRFTPDGKTIWTEQDLPEQDPAQQDPAQQDPAQQDPAEQDLPRSA